MQLKQVSMLYRSYLENKIDDFSSWVDIDGIDTANALICYECPLGCEGDDKSKWPTQDCGGASATGQQKICLKQVITRTGAKDRVVRKCSLPPAGKKFECIDAPGEKTTVCETCTADYCNSASSVTFSFLAIASVIVPFLATRLH